jgi:hypothetical protein
MIIDQPIPDIERRLDKSIYLANRRIWIDFIQEHKMYSKCSQWNSCYRLKQALTRLTGGYLFAADMMALLDELGFKTKWIDGYPYAKAKLSSAFIKSLRPRDLAIK